MSKLNNGYYPIIWKRERENMDYCDFGFDKFQNKFWYFWVFNFKTWQSNSKITEAISNNLLVGSNISHHSCIKAIQLFKPLVKQWFGKDYDTANSINYSLHTFLIQTSVWKEKTFKSQESV